MIVLGIIIGLIFLSGYIFMHGAQFGAMPAGKRLIRIQQSPNYREGQFLNRSPTPQLTEGSSMFDVLRKFFFDKTANKIPPAPLPSRKTDLLNLDPSSQTLVWFGHSSYFIQVDGKKILVDPVFSGNASPFSFTTKSFKGSDIYTVPDVPDIDYLIISHDHWDHLDYKTILLLKPTVRKIITSLGVGAHLESWGFDKNRIYEMDWNEEVELDEGFTLNSVTARHFSGRGFKRNRTIWSSFVLKTPGKKIFIGGDSGYDRHFEDIGNRFGPFDLAILENGQYNLNWKYIHMLPEETVQAAIDLKSKKLLPVHWAKFNLSLHAWNEPILRILKEAEKKNMNLLHPMIGEAVNLDIEQKFENWWEGVH
jgi:L-ascorbate metabolism protein UlaG (beta-lactamase superfamily)